MGVERGNAGCLFVGALPRPNPGERALIQNTFFTDPRDAAPLFFPPRFFSCPRPRSCAGEGRVRVPSRRTFFTNIRAVPPSDSLSLSKERAGERSTDGSSRSARSSCGAMQFRLTSPAARATFFTDTRARLRTPSPVSWGRVGVGVERGSAGCFFVAALPRPNPGDRALIQNAFFTNPRGAPPISALVRCWSPRCLTPASLIRPIQPPS